MLMSEVGLTAQPIAENEQADTGELPNDSISWSASEFLHHEKTGAWYLKVMGTVCLVAIVLFLLTKDLVGPISLVVLGSLLMVSAARKPRTLQYLVDHEGVVVGSREYRYDDFQSFSIVNEDQIESIALYPHKRFSPIISMYFDPKDGQQIFDMLSTYLPFEQREMDQLDKFLHKIKF